MSLEKYRGHVLIIVNVASKCGYTAKHYHELNELFDEYAEAKGKIFLEIPFYISLFLMDLKKDTLSNCQIEISISYKI